MPRQIIEWAPFTLAEGATEEELLGRSEELQAQFLAGQDGFIRRELLQGEGREWVDLVYWRDAAAVQQAIRRAAESPVCHRYFQLMVGADHQEPGAGVTSYAIRQRFEAPAAASALPAA